MSQLEFWSGIITIVCVQVGGIMIKLYSMYLDRKVKTQLAENTKLTEEIHTITVPVKGKE